MLTVSPGSDPKVYFVPVATPAQIRAGYAGCELGLAAPVALPVPRRRPRPVGLLETRAATLAAELAAAGLGDAEVDRLVTLDAAEQVERLLKAIE